MTYLIKQQSLLVLLLTTIVCKADNQPIKKSHTTAIPVKDSLVKHIVLSNGHPMAVWAKKVENPKGHILFVHGRTWSGVPDFDLQVEGEELSLMDGLVEQEYSTYAIDLRGYGKTPRDATEWSSPEIASNDILNIIKWISEENNKTKIHLFGWSMGSTLSLLATQKESKNIASLTVFGYWQDLDSKIPEDTSEKKLLKSINTAENAASDFIIPGSISKKAVDTYVKMALAYDPIRVDWRHESEYNSIDPALITTPILLIQGEFDPLAPTVNQAKLFMRLKTADKSWVVISGGDHAAFMEKPRKHFIQSFTAFIDRFNE